MPHVFKHARLRYKTGSGSSDICRFLLVDVAPLQRQRFADAQARLQNKNSFPSMKGQTGFGIAEDFSSFSMATLTIYNRIEFAI